jgi:hypothetical protein
MAEIHSLSATRAGRLKETHGLPTSTMELDLDTELNIAGQHTWRPILIASPPRGSISRIVFARYVYTI